MRFLNAFLLGLMFFAALCRAQPDGEEIERLKIDFRQVRVVARIQIEKIEVESEWGKPREGGGYTIYRFTGAVVEGFKGKFKKGDPIVFYSFIESQPFKKVTDLAPNNPVRFLKIYRSKFGLTNLTELENSAHAASEANLTTLRRLRAALNRKKRL